MNYDVILEISRDIFQCWLLKNPNASSEQIVSELHNSATYKRQGEPGSGVVIRDAMVERPLEEYVKLVQGEIERGSSIRAYLDRKYRLDDGLLHAPA